jgi:hypothetical protein
MFQFDTKHNFGIIATGDESWFLDAMYADSVFAASAVEVVPMTRQSISSRKTMVTIVFASI